MIELLANSLVDYAKSINKSVQLQYTGICFIIRSNQTRQGIVYLYKDGTISYYFKNWPDYYPNITISWPNCINILKECIQYYA